MESNQLLRLSSSDLRRAAELKERIDVLNAELAEILGGAGEASNDGGRVGGGRRSMSAEAKKRIGDAARARWAKVRAAKGGAGSSANDRNAGAKKRRTMSPAARKKIAEAAKARWARVRAAKGRS